MIDIGNARNPVSQSEARRTCAVVGGMAAVALLAYAFAASGLHIANDALIEDDPASAWQRMSTPQQTGLAKQR